jgi:N utilization substance protein B
MKTRRAAREWAMKVLYAHKISDEAVDLIMGQFYSGSIQSPHYRFAEQLVKQTLALESQLDTLIRSHVEKWELERIAVIDRIILRMAICEIRYFDDIPPKVTINEAIEIAKKYSTAKSDKFVNGVLDAVLRDTRPVGSSEPQAEVGGS